MQNIIGSTRAFFLFAGVVLLIPQTSAAQQKKDNSGKEFYIAFAQNQGSMEDSNLFALYVTSKVPTHGTVEVTGLGFSQQFAAAPGTITTITLPDGRNGFDPSVEVTLDETVVAGMAVHVTADDDVTIYGISSKQYSTDAFMALPVTVLGTEYRTINYNSSYFGDTPGEFWIVGTADSTTVTITPKAQTRSGHTTGVPFTVTLGRGDVYLVQGVAADPLNDLTGSLIESDEPIAVLSGHVRTEIPHNFRSEDDTATTSRNHLVEQMSPVSTWGDSALVVPYAGASLPDLVRIVSANDSNAISVNGAIAASLNAGDVYEITHVTGPLSIQGTSPILVGQYMHTGQFNALDSLVADRANGDPAFALVFPVEQFDTSYTFISATRALFTRNFVNVVAGRSAIADMTLDGVPVGVGQFQPIPGANNVYARIELQQGTHSISAPEPFGITVYALGPADAYAYTGGSLLKTITPFKTVDLSIDFGDRVMTITPGPVYSGSWDTTVYLQNISSDPYTINSFQTRGGNAANFTVVDPTAARRIGPGEIDSMTIRFSPDVPYQRMHSTVMAMTEHLKAYVVDVYGRGVLDDVNAFRDVDGAIPIDTLDFGIFQMSDNPKDSVVFVLNKGEQDATISRMAIDPSNAQTNSAAFVIHSTTIGGTTVTIPYGLPKYRSTLPSSDTVAAITITFTPIKDEPNGLREAALTLTTSHGLQRKVVLLARIHSIRKSTITNVQFDSISACQNEVRAAFVDNPNDFAVTVMSVTLGGTNSSDFTVITPLPLRISASSRGAIQLKYEPGAVGASSATAVLSFDLPVGFAEEIPLSASSYRLSSKFWASKKIHTPGEEQLFFPIYAKVPMQTFGSRSFLLTLDYDRSHLEDVGIVQENTLTAGGSYLISTDAAGRSQYYYQSPDNSVVSGGGDSEVRPILYVKFRSHLNGEDPRHFHAAVDIKYSIAFDHASVPSDCILSDAPEGMITIDSTCETVVLMIDTILNPPAAYLMLVRPNPVVDAHATFSIAVPREDVVHLDVIDVRGTKVTTILDELRKPGRYDVSWDSSHLMAGTYYVRLSTAGVVRYQQMHVVR